MSKPETRVQIEDNVVLVVPVANQVIRFVRRHSGEFALADETETRTLAHKGIKHAILRQPISQLPQELTRLAGRTNGPPSTFDPSSSAYELQFSLKRTKL